MNSTRACRYGVTGLAVAYLLALALFAIGTLGLFGSEPDPLAGVFLIPLGLPWTLFIDDLAPESLWPWLAALTPVINLLIVFAICRWLKSRNP